MPLSKTLALGDNDLEGGLATAAWSLTAVGLPPNADSPQGQPACQAPHLCQLRGEFLPSLQAGTLASHLSRVTGAGSCPLPSPLFLLPNPISVQPREAQTPPRGNSQPAPERPHPVLSKTLDAGPGHPEPAVPNSL